MVLKFTRFAIKSTALSIISFYGYHYLHQLQKPKPHDFKGNKGKKKEIVILGTGMTGLVTAYYLSAYKHN